MFVPDLEKYLFFNFDRARIISCIAFKGVCLALMVNPDDKRG